MREVMWGMSWVELQMLAKSISVPEATAEKEEDSERISTKEEFESFINTLQ